MFEKTRALCFPMLLVCMLSLLTISNSVYVWFTGTQVDVLQRNSQASQAALQLLRTDHSQQTSRLAAANAELLQLRGQVSSLQAALQQQQQDVASALSIMSCRDAAAPAAAGAVASAAAATSRSGLQQTRAVLTRQLYSGGDASGSDGEWQQQQQQVRGS
jgi:nitrogen fixation/metabolism regulation signal transduction histidine kinase